LVAQLRRLARRRSERSEQGRFLVEGATLVAHALDAEAHVEVFLRDGEAGSDAAERALADRAAAAGARLVELAPGSMSRVTDAVSPQPVAAVVAKPSWALAEVLADAVGRGRPLLVLADVNDPGNAGTLMRSAEASGCAGIVCCGGVDPFGPKTVRASAGALFLVPVVEHPQVRLALAALGDARVHRVGLAAHGGVPLDVADLRGAVAFVLGSESHGLPDGLDRALDEVVTIPMVGRSESLNVAMAGTLAVFEAARQRRVA
jgi:tRNA G18 (ribose-2'-O)-methylase SpoU